MLFNYFQLYANQANTATDVQSNTTDSAKSVKNSVTFARSSVERPANMKAATTFFFWCARIPLASLTLLVDVLHLTNFRFRLMKFTYLACVMLSLWRLANFTLTLGSKTSDSPNTLESFRKGWDELSRKVPSQSGKLHDRNMWIFTLRVKVHIKRKKRQDTLINKNNRIKEVKCD